jgi:2-polyprenyl-3-methyl-5-hydroxy-6-metoxy-1,4-benzoquinol methylase
VKEEDIRPQAIFDEYLRLASLDADKYFGVDAKNKISCPACRRDGVFVFKKHGFYYDECPNCLTIYVSPRPEAEAFFKYYQNSDSSKYFATTFYKATETARRERLWKPKALEVQTILKRHQLKKPEIVDIGGGYGIFAEEYQKLSGSSVVIIEPGPDLAGICRQKGLTVVQQFLEKVKCTDLSKSPKAFVSFELFEHLHDPGLFIDRLHSLMRSGDIFIFTTLSGTGVDIRALWDKSNSISLQHLNFFNPTSIKIFLERMKLKVLEISTPGKLDLDILANNREKIKDKFWKAFIDQASPSVRELWQTFISEQGRSSHMWVVCECP